MRRLKLIGLALIAMLSLGIASASMAQAVEFHLKVLPEDAKFTFASTANTETRLETLEKKAIVCKKVEGSGNFTTERLGQVEFKFSSCKDAILGTTCTGLADTAGNITVKGEFHIRHLLPATEGVNIAVLVTGVHFSCLGILFTVNGCIASKDILKEKAGVSAVNLLLTEMFVEFSQNAGDPSVPSIDTDNSLAMETCELLTKQEAGSAVMSGQAGSGTLKNFQNKEGVSVTGLIDLEGTA